MLSLHRQDQSKKIFFITGVSSGIGYAAAEFFLNNGHIVVGTVRKIDDAENLKNQYGELFKPIILDLLQISQIENLKAELYRMDIHNIDILIQNAGVALAAPLEYQPFSEIEMILNLNVLSVIKVTQELLPFLKKSANKSRIINMSSVSGVGGTPFLAAYCASKHAIEGYSESIRRELRIYGIKVSIVGPGSIKTPIWDKGFKTIAHRYDQTEYKDAFHKFIDFASYEKDHALPVENVVSCLEHASFAPYPKLRYSPIPRKIQNWFLPKFIPKCIYDYLMCKTLGLLSQIKTK